MKKRILSVILMLILSISIVAILTSCDLGGTDTTCNHSYGNWSIEKDATCTEDGQKSRTCSACSNKETETIEKPGHTWDKGTPDPSAAGVTVYKCIKCNATDKKGSPETGHTHDVDNVAAQSNTCTTSGNIEYWYCEGCDTRFSDEALTTTVSANDVIIPAAHTSSEFIYSVNAADETKHDKKHACCGEIIETKDHQWNNGVTDPDVSGGKIFTCTVCQHTKKVGHTHDVDNVAAQSNTCTTSGNIEYWYCEGCDTRFSDEALTTTVSANDVIIPAAHTSSEFIYSVNAADETKHDKKHACCGEFETTENHENEVISTTPVSCSADGTKTVKCKYCPKQTTETVQTKSGHSVETWYFDSETAVAGKTCEYDQLFVGECSRCGEDFDKTVKSVRHEMVATIKKAAKCNEPGEKTYASVHGCADTSYDKSYTDANAHNWGVGVVNGDITTYTCAHCNGTKTAVVYNTTTATVDKSMLSNNEISLSGISLKLDSTTLGLVSDGDVLLEANIVPDNKKEELASNPALSETIQNLIRTGKVYDFGIKQGENYISDFKGGKVTVTIPYTSTGSNVDLIAVCYIGSDGNVEVVGATYSNGYITFEAKHFSSYIPSEVSEEEACLVYGHNYSDAITPATCNERGYTTKNCDRCGSSIVTDIAYELGHILTDGRETPATCTSEGKIIYTCTREGCGEVVEVIIAKKEHEYRYDSENSKITTCTEDGYNTEKCFVCGHTKRTDYEATGHYIHEWSRAEYEFAAGSTKCTDGIIEKRYCVNEGCEYYEVNTRYEHISLLDKMSNPEDYPSLSQNEIRIDIFDHSNYDYANNPMTSGRESPYILISPACLCGDLTGRVEFYSGDFMMDMFSCDSVTALDGTYVSTLNGSEFWDPMTQTYPDDFRVVFVIRTEKDVCHYQKYVDIYIGGDSEGNDATYEMTVLISEYDSHIEAERAELLDPSLSCFYSGLLNNYQGILVTKYCSECDTVLSEYGTSVSADSKHYLIPTGTSYEYSTKISNYENHVIRFTLQRCPCDTFYVDLFYNNVCLFREVETATVDGNEVKVYKCSTCDFMYGKCEVEDTSNCRHKKTIIYYTAMEGSDGTYTYDQKMTYEAFNYENFYTHLNRETIKTDIETSDPCVHKYEQVITCTDCEEELSRNIYTEWNHDTNETVTVDEHGNEIKNITCKRDNCNYHYSVTKDKNGNEIRRYSVSCDYEGEYVYKDLTINAEINGAFYSTFNRSETYDTEGHLISWRQSVYSKSYDTKYNRCILLGRYSDSSGGYSESQVEICVYSDERVSQTGSCTQEGYDYTYCIYCQNKQYSYQQSAYGHEYSYMGSDDQGNTIYYCYRCQTELYVSYSAVDIERLYHLEEEKADGNIYIGYYNRNGTMDTVGIQATVSLIAAEYSEDGKTITSETELDVEITDDGLSKLSFSEEEFSDALSSAGYDENKTDVSWAGMFKVVINDGSNNVLYLKLT